jgi:large subunit ribosomal protein L17
MASSLIMHKRIETTTAKAKALKRYIEPLITRGKDDTTHSRRVVFSYLQDKEAVTELFREVSSRVADRPGGYTRIIRLGNRLGDNADMCLIELVDFNENLLAEKAASRKSSTRRRRGAKKKAEGVAAATEAEVDTAVAEGEATEGPEVAEGEITDAAVEEVKEEPETKAEEPIAEVETAPAEEVKEEPEAKAEEPIAEVEAAPAEEVKEEAKAEEPKEEEKKEDNEKKE